MRAPSSRTRRRILIAGVFSLILVLLASLVVALAWPRETRSVLNRVGRALRNEPQRGVLGLESGAATSRVALGTYRPEFPNDLRALGSGVTIVHWFALWGGWKSQFSREDLNIVTARGAVPMISWEPWAGAGNDPAWSLRDGILSGKHDAYIATWARGLADYGRPVLLRFAHEMHHQSYPWALGVNGNTAEDYVAAWRHVREIFRRYNAVNVRWVWNPNTLGDDPASIHSRYYGPLYPGDGAVNWLGLDIYNTGPQIDWGAPYCRAFDQVVAEPYAAITAVAAKPIVLSEVGTAEGCGSKADWISQALRSDLPTKFPRIQAFVWFDVDKEARWALRSSPGAFETWIDLARTITQPPLEAAEQAVAPNQRVYLPTLAHQVRW